MVQHLLLKVMPTPCLLILRGPKVDLERHVNLQNSSTGKWLVFHYGFVLLIEGWFVCLFVCNMNRSIW